MTDRSVEVPNDSSGGRLLQQKSPRGSPREPGGDQATTPSEAGDVPRPAFERWLFGLSLALFAVTRFVGLEDFPIYFFCDEAIHSVLAGDLIRSGFRHDGQLFPTYFNNGESFNLSVSVYLQVIPYLLSRHSVFLTRGVSALLAILAGAAVGGILLKGFRARFWWAGVLLLSATPAWFLHSRTAFEVVLACSFYSLFIYFYLRYRLDDRRFLLPSLLCGALAFYAYTAIQPVVLLTGALLLVSDARHHLRQWRIALLGLAALVVFALPYQRFRTAHPDEVYRNLRIRESYLLRKDLTPVERLRKFADEYVFGVSPSYWYVPENPRDFVRHRMKDYGHISIVTLPFALLGVLLCLWTIRRPASRTILISAAVAPVGGALAGVLLPRVLVFVIPVAVLTALGLSMALRGLERWIPHRIVAVSIFLLLGAANLVMLGDSLMYGGTWYRDYGLGGLQYGARQVFPAARDYLRRSPEAALIISPTWANGTDILHRFFLPDEPRVQLGNIDAFIERKRPLDDRTVFVMTQPEYARAVSDPRFMGIRVERTLKYPDGTDGFYFVRLRYSKSADAIFESEERERLRPVEEEFVLDGQPARIVHPRFSVGRVPDLFDGDPYTLVRTESTNPAVLELSFSRPRRLSGLTVTTGTMNIELTVQAFTPGTAAPRVFSKTYEQLPPDPTVRLAFAPILPAVEKLRISIRGTNLSERDGVHVREVLIR